MKKKLFIGIALIGALFAFKAEKAANLNAARSKSKSSATTIQMSTPSKGIDTNRKSVIKLASVPGPGSNSLPILRYYNPTSHLHFYTTSSTELGDGALGYHYERTIGWLRKLPGNSGNTVNRFANNSTGAHYYAIASTAPGGFHYESALGVQAFTPFAVTIVNILQYHSAGGDYLYTDTLSGETLTNYVSDGVAYVAATGSF